MNQQTYQERILTELNKVPGGLTSVELRERTGIQPNVLSTTLWEMKKDGSISRIGGVRGRYVYGITAKGKEQLPGREKDPITRLVESVRKIDTSGQTYNELLHVIEKAEDFRLLTGFIDWLTERAPEVFNQKMNRETLRDRLYDSALMFMGVDPEAYRMQRESLEALLRLT